MEKSLQEEMFEVFDSLLEAGYSEDEVSELLQDEEFVNDLFEDMSDYSADPAPDTSLTKRGTNAYEKAKGKARGRARKLLHHLQDKVVKGDKGVEYNEYTPDGDPIDELTGKGKLKDLMRKHTADADASEKITGKKFGMDRTKARLASSLHYRNKYKGTPRLFRPDDWSGVDQQLKRAKRGTKNM